eukprot:CAMPEP_0202370084 /NCGR_PEP_ID=MMETSP1127-20130417/1788_1 /ASSEMBLY_ACC=CAM_ASM_000462 /TAXON_ID=3047 /ORGANISM="Dunaliella tertiolecta, Strain CCMP1320" /LENGTH=253 /DNA_ID=CAMNT_0048965943 /DNA_START=1461 /DNA_END=2223 /DNA_ORIENTATION=+
MRGQFGAELAQLLCAQADTHFTDQLSIKHHVEVGHLLDAHGLEDGHKCRVCPIQLGPQHIWVVAGNALHFGVQALAHVAVLGEELRDQQLALRLRPLHDRAVLVRALAGGHVEGLVALEPLQAHALHHLGSPLLRVQLLVPGLPSFRRRTASGCGHDSTSGCTSGSETAELPVRTLGLRDCCARSPAVLLQSKPGSSRRDCCLAAKMTALLLLPVVLAASGLCSIPSIASKVRGTWQGLLLKYVCPIVSVKRK